MLAAIWFVAFTSISVILLANIPTTEAVTQVGVVLSKTCLTMIQSNISSACPTYADLFELDTSNQAWSGEFSNVTGLREAPPYPASWKLYNHETESRVFVDPPPDMMPWIKLITIQPNFDTYLLPDSHASGRNSSTTVVENVFKCTKWTDDICVERPTQELIEYSGPYRIVYHDRYVDRCHWATINAEKWQMLVADTIYYLKNSCEPQFTSYNEKEFVPITLQEHDIATTKKWQYDAWLNDVKKHCIFKFKACT